MTPTIIAEWQDQKFDVCVLTQNIDGFHRDAGNRNLIEIHGDIHDLLFLPAAITPLLCRIIVVWKSPGLSALPIAGAAVVLFGEALPSAAIQHLYAELDQGFDLVFSIGTTSVFPYIAGRRRNDQHGVPCVGSSSGLYAGSSITR